MRKTASCQIYTQTDSSISQNITDGKEDKRDGPASQNNNDSASSLNRHFCRQTALHTCMTAFAKSHLNVHTKSVSIHSCKADIPVSAA